MLSWLPDPHYPDLTRYELRCTDLERADMRTKRNDAERRRTTRTKRNHIDKQIRPHTHMYICAPTPTHAHTRGRERADPARAKAVELASPDELERAAPTTWRAARVLDVRCWMLDVRFGVGLDGIDARR